MEADHHRLLVVALMGLIKNDYNDFLGTGKPLKSEDNLHALVSRYLYRVTGDWFAGLQGASTNYQIIGQNAMDEEMLQKLGLTGFRPAASAWPCCTIPGTSSSARPGAGI